MHPLVVLADGRQGHFQFESGHHGDLHLDLDRLFSQTEELQPHVKDLAKQLAPYRSEVFLGPMEGGGLLAELLAIEANGMFACADRDDFDPANVTYTLPPDIAQWLSGKRVAVVDDAINAGSAVRKTLAALRACGGIPVALGTLIIAGSAPDSLANGDKLPLFAVTRVDANLWTPRECPLCRSGAPLAVFS